LHSTRVAAEITSGNEKDERREKGKNNLGSIHERRFIMPTRSIFSKFIIKDEKTMQIFLKKNNTKGRKTPKIDIRKKIEEGKKVLETF